MCTTTPKNGTLYTDDLESSIGYINPNFKNKKTTTKKYTFYTELALNFNKLFKPKNVIIKKMVMLNSVT